MTTASYGLGERRRGDVALYGTVLGLVATGAEVDEGYSVYAVDEYIAQARSQPEVVPQSRLEDVSEAQSASGASGRWMPRRGG